MALTQAVIPEMISIEQQAKRPSSTEFPSVQPSALLNHKLRRLGWHMASTSALTALAIAVVVGIEVLGLAMLLDWWIDLPWTIRLILFLAQASLLGWLLLHHILRPVLRRATCEELALAVEHALPQFRTRLIACVQLTRPRALAQGDSHTMVAALIEQTEALAAGVDFNAIVPVEKLKTLGLAAICVSAIAVAVFCHGRPVTTELLKRALLSHSPVPRKTSVDVVDARKIVGRGDDVRLQAYARGIVPKHGWAETRGANGQTQKLPMERNSTGLFVREINNVQDSFDYRVQLNDGRSEFFHIKVVTRPAVLSLACEQHFPAYTRLSPTPKPPSDLALLAGSVLKLRVQPTRPVESASIKLVGPGTIVPLQTANSNEWRGEFIVPAKGVNGFLIHMRDTEGMESKNSAVYRIEIVTDKPPTVRITAPTRKEELFTRGAIANIGMHIADDFEVSRVRLRFRVDSEGQTNVVQTIDLDIGGQPRSKLAHRFEWKLREVQPSLGIGGRFEFWIEAEDNNNVTGPGAGASEHYFARIVTEDEKRADLWNRATDTLGSINDIASDQDKLNETLGTLIRQKIADAAK